MGRGRGDAPRRLVPVVTRFTPADEIGDITTSDVAARVAHAAEAISFGVPDYAVEPVVLDVREHRVGAA